MYSLVLATMLTTGQATPAWGCFGCHGCHGCCGCYGCSGCWGCCGCCGGCWGCWGCYGCCGGCWGCYGCCGGCWGCYGCYGCYGCWGCYGCCCGGGVVVAPAATVAVPAVVEPARTLPPPMQKVSAGAATVIVKAPTDVRITVNGQDMSRSAAEESFSTPELQQGRTYQYVFKAEVVRDGKPVTVTKNVSVLAGQQSVADFTDLDAGAALAVAKVTVRLPEDARLYVDGVLCPLTSAVRTFETPKLEAGRQYFYTVKAEVMRDGKAESESRRVVVEAGKETTVEFKDLVSVQAARR